MALLFKDITAASASTRQPRSAMGARRRRIMRAFRIDEISAVDRPAQAHAKVLLQKRDDTPVARHQPKEHTKMNTSTDYRNIDLGRAGDARARRRRRGVTEEPARVK